MELKRRVAMARFTRSRSVQTRNIPGDLMLEYYSQRASDAGLIVSEATSISVAGGGWFAAPGVYSEEQVAGWKRITDAIHQKRGYMFSQLWHTGRARPVDSTNGATPVSSSVNPEYWQDPTILESTPHGWRQPLPHHALDITEIPGIVEDYRNAAQHANAAGFDGIELHAGNGYLPDQFLQDGVNRRTDIYGGPIENRSRFLLK
jgi:N-ethylmaleimide reductase